MADDFVVPMFVQHTEAMLEEIDRMVWRCRHRLTD